MELFAFFLLALLGFVMPILATVLSIFAQGLARLEQQYQTEKSQTEDKLRGQLKKTGDSATIDVHEIERTIKELEKVKKAADRKLRFLSPKKAIILICAPLFTAFLLVVVTFLDSLPDFIVWLPLVSLLLVTYSLRQLWNVFDIIVETNALLETEQKNERRVVPDLLAEIVRNTKQGADVFIQDIFINLQELRITPKSNELTLDINKKTTLKVSIVNSDDRMAKDVEIGFSFPQDFLIEKSAGYTIYATGTEQIVRYAEARIHGNTTFIKQPLVLTPLKKGDFVLDTWIKGENIRSLNRKLKIIVSSKGG